MHRADFRTRSNHLKINSSALEEHKTSERVWWLTYAPAAVVSWAANLPPWIDLRPTPESTEEFERLDAGERAAILLAEAQQAPVLLLMDDSDGRAEAKRRGIPVTGTLGIIRAAALSDLIDLPKVLKNLVGTNFRCPAKLINELLAEDAERKRTR